MKFAPIFTLRVTHTYYTDGGCADFLIEPNPETERLLRNHRCVFKPLPYGARVLIAVDDEESPYIALPKDVSLTFLLRLQNPDFTLFTDLSELSEQPAPLFTNADSSSEGSQKLILTSRSAWFIEDFSVVQPASEESFTLAGRPLAGLKPDKFKIEGSTKVILKAYNPRGKVITVDSHSVHKDDKFTVKYPISPQLERDVFADVEIRWNKAFSTVGDGPVEFQIEFGAKQSFWKYYFVTDLKRSGGEFKIVDTDPSDSKTAIEFSDKNRTDLNQQPDSSDDLAQALIQQYPDEEIQKLRFISDKPLFCCQAARKYLQLWMGESPLIGALPNPSIRNYTQTDVKPGAEPDRQDSLFQVVEYLIHLK